MRYILCAILFSIISILFNQQAVALSIRKGLKSQQTTLQGSTLSMYKPNSFGSLKSNHVSSNSYIHNSFSQIILPLRQGTRLYMGKKDKRTSKDKPKQSASEAKNRLDETVRKFMVGSSLMYL